VGGYPEAFCGWGYEDAAMRRALIALHGQPPTPPLDLTAQLWHPRAARTNEDRNRAMFERFDAAVNSPSLMRQVIAEHRGPR
jgi:predicted glycosyltransferase involved in capsule biosynthesis